MLQWALRAMLGVVLCGVMVACDQYEPGAADAPLEDSIGGDVSSSAAKSTVEGQAEEAAGNDAPSEDSRADGGGQKNASEDGTSESPAAQHAAPEFELRENPIELDLTLPSELRNIDAPYSNGEEPSMLPDLFNTSKSAEQKTKISGELILNDAVPEQPLTDRLGVAKLDVQVPIR